MAVTLQVKRGLKAALPALSDGEFGWCTDTFELFIGSGAGNKQVSTEGATTPHEMPSTGPHYGSGLTVGYVIRATAATTFAWAQLQHADLGGVGANDHHTQLHASSHVVGGADALSVGVPVDIGTANAEGSATNLARRDHVHAHPSALGANLHHNQSHVLSGGDHTASGLTVGHVIRATGASAFAWAQLQHTDLGGVTANQHHTRYADSEAIAAVEAAAFTSLDADTFQNTGNIIIDAINAAADSTIYLKNSNATYKANVDVEGILTVGTNLVLDGVSKKITFEANDYIYYVGDTFNFYIANTMRASLDANKLMLMTADGLSIGGTNRRITFDTNDYLEYDADTYWFAIGLVDKMSLSGTTLDLGVSLKFSGTREIESGVSDLTLKFTEDAVNHYLDITNTGTGHAGLKVNSAVVVSPTGVVDGGAF